ncbi:MAG: ferrous iron transport protein B [Longicatena sp.]
MILIERLIKINKAINEQYLKEKKGYTIALVGNPNVGKSTLFNGLTGMKQHTGNWPGKTVELARGHFQYKNYRHEMIDLPGTYSLLAHSSEEEVTRNYICFERCDICMIVCDATCLERNLNLVLQTLEITNKVIVVLNLMDEASKKHIRIDTKKLALLLGVEVVPMSARNHDGFVAVKEAIVRVEKRKEPLSNIIKYDIDIEQAILKIESIIESDVLNKRFLALKFLDSKIENTMFYDVVKNSEHIVKQCASERNILKEKHKLGSYEEMLVNALDKKAKEISNDCVSFENLKYQSRDMKIDQHVTSKGFGLLWMVVLLVIVFWITISGANLPSEMLSTMFEHMEESMHALFIQLQVTPILSAFIIDGVFKTCGWVVAVMLPPMAIFFPLFTLLEDFGYLPRIAFNLDGFFQKAGACGKQALTMCMGFGCNAVGVSGTRIIDSPRERLLAIITNVFVPCNGRFPTLISILTMFFAGMFIKPWNTIFSTFLLTSIVIFGIFLTLIVSKFISATLLKGLPSSFTLELPPFRKPQIGKVILRSIMDRTLFVLGRAISVAIPAGAIIWLLANIQYMDVSLLAIIANYLDPFASMMGLDGVILLAFILGFPANEIVVPIIIMAYLANGSMSDMNNLVVLKELFVNNGWTWLTALCTMIFSLAHFPCATTLLTIYKETKSMKWTWISFLLPTIIGILLCMCVNGIGQFFV